jgi:hypothetical protein
MATKLFGRCVKVVAVIFTSLVAPLLVNIAVMHLKAEGGTPPASERTMAQKERNEHISGSSNAGEVLSISHAMQAPTSELSEMIRVIVKGSGRTPEEALQDGLRTSLSRAIAAQVGAETWAKYGPSLFGKVSRESAGIIRGWNEIGSSKEWKLRGIVHYKEVAVVVDRIALERRLRAVSVPKIAAIGNLSPFTDSISTQVPPIAFVPR